MYTEDTIENIMNKIMATQDIGNFNSKFMFV